MSTNQSQPEKLLDIAIYFRSKARSAAVAFFAWDFIRRYWNDDLTYFVKDYDQLVKFLTEDYQLIATRNADIFNPGRAIAWYDLITEFKKMIPKLFSVMVFLKRGGLVSNKFVYQSIYGENHMLNVIENEINKD